MRFLHPAQNILCAVLVIQHLPAERTDDRKDSSGQRGSTLNHSLLCGNVLWDQVKK